MELRTVKAVYSGHCNKAATSFLQPLSLHASPNWNEVEKHRTSYITHVFKAATSLLQPPIIGPRVGNHKTGSTRLLNDGVATTPAARKHVASL